MVKTRRVHFRVSQEQYLMIRNDSMVKGHKTVSSYIRSLALGHDYKFHEKFNELYDYLLKARKKDEKTGNNTERRTNGVQNI
ncbi:MAG TPA: hypothetical protein VJI46_06385 [Candidatus Nanoarchaeia archaeon]|nr:hypothetical protein [Candidatus Nanoarchaeia archaeon]